MYVDNSDNINHQNYCLSSNIISPEVAIYALRGGVIMSCSSSSSVLT